MATFVLCGNAPTRCKVPQAYFAFGCGAIWLAEAEEWARVRLSCNYGSEPLTSSPELMPFARCKT
jgi:hypothetical protein